MDKIRELQSKRDKIKKELIKIGDMRRGSVTEQYLPVKHKGIDKPVLCGPYYVFTTKIEGKTVGRRLQVGPELKKIRQEVRNFHHFQKLCREIISVNEQICELRPLSSRMLEDKQVEVKKKLKRKYKRKRDEK